MKNLFKALLLAVMLITFALSACTQRDNTGGGDSDPPASTPAAPTETVVVNATDDSVEVEDIYLNEHDFTVYFEITVDGSNVSVEKEYLDLSALKQEAGTYTVSCAYKGESASIQVTVLHNDYLLSLSQEEITVFSYHNPFGIISPFHSANQPLQPPQNRVHRVFVLPSLTEKSQRL